MTPSTALEPTVTKDERRIKFWAEQLEYHLTNFDRATDVGSDASAERSRTTAAECAAILTALKEADRED